MMKRSNVLFGCAALVLAAVFSCKDATNLEPEPEPGDPKLTLSEDSVEAPAEGGVFFIEYTLENPVEGEEFVFDGAADWFEIYAEEDGNKFIVEVDENATADERSAVVNGHYADIDFTVTVSQEVVSAFAISVSDEKESSFVISVIPDDKEMTYLCTQIEHNQYSIYSSAEEYIQAYKNSFAYIASLYGLTVPQYMEKLGLIRKGDIKDELVRNVVPGRTYYVCCVGYDPKTDGLTTALNKVSCETVAIEYQETSFDLELYVNGPVVGLDVTPEDPERRYVTGAVQFAGSGDVDPYDIVTSMQVQLFQLYDKITDSGFEFADAVKGVTYAGQDHFIWELVENQRYFAFAVAVDLNTGFINSTPNVVEANTTAVQPSDNVITIEVSDIEQYQAYAKITVTNEYDPYILGTIPVSQLEGLSDEEILTELTSGKYSLPQAKSGSRELTLTNLQANTEYYALAWGSVKMQPTTKLYKVKFTTLDVETGKASLDLKCDKYFDGDELLAQYPEIFEGMDISGKAVLPVTAVPSGDYEVFYHYVGKGKFTSVFTDDYLNNKFLPQFGSSDMHKYYVVDYGFTYKIAGNAFDKDGMPGRVFRKEIKTSETEASPVSEFVPFDESEGAGMPSLMKVDRPVEEESLMIVLK